jgi:hypothetical protein
MGTADWITQDVKEEIWNEEMRCRERIGWGGELAWMGIWDE